MSPRIKAMLGAAVLYALAYGPGLSLAITFKK
jgi:hypothetical protein